MKAWMGTGRRTCEVNQIPERKANRPSEGYGKEAKTEGRGTQRSNMAIGEVPSGSNVHSKRIKMDTEGD